MDFKNYIMEQNILTEKSVNPHITHLEDNVFEGPGGIEKAIQYIGPIFDTLDGVGKNISMKWDGSPAVVFGLDPVKNKFFVSTKAIFAKEPRVAYTESDVENNFTNPSLVPMLKEVLQYLEMVKPRNIYQGDLLFSQSGHGKKKEIINGKQYLTFTPNTITYAVPFESDLAKEIIRAKIGIIVHTRYKGEIGNLTPTFNVDESEFTKTPYVWLRDAFINNVSDVNIEPEELRQITSILRNIDSKKGIVEKISPKIIALLQLYKNSRIRDNVGILTADVGINDFITYLKEKYENDINILKTDSAKEAKKKDLDRVIEYINDNSENIMLVFKIYNWFVRIKMIILRKLNQIDSIGTFVRQGDSYKVTTPEGFVAISNDGSVTKLVDRLEFSRLNFTIPKNW
jgi:hypothetical protein